MRHKNNVENLTCTLRLILRSRVLRGGLIIGRGCAWRQAATAFIRGCTKKAQLFAEGSIVQNAGNPKPELLTDLRRKFRSGGDSFYPEAVSQGSARFYGKQPTLRLLLVRGFSLRQKKADRDQSLPPRRRTSCVPGE